MRRFGTVFTSFQTNNAHRSSATMVETTWLLHYLDEFRIWWCWLRFKQNQCGTRNVQTIATNHGGGCFLNLTFVNFPKFVRPLRTRSFEAKICALNHGETHSCFKTTLAGSSTLKERGEIPSTIFCVAKSPFNYLGSCSILATIHLYRRYVKRLVLSWTTESQCLDRHDVTQSDKCLPSKSSHERCISRMELGLHSNGHGSFGSMTKYLRQKRWEHKFSKSDCVMISVPWA